jgi:cytochrome c553
MLAVAVSALGLVVVAGCGGEEEASPTPETVTGTTTTDTGTTETDTTETDTTETDTTDTETTDTTTDTGGGGTGQGDAAAGKQVFLGAPACGGCHTLADAGTTGTVGPNLDDAKPGFDLVVDRVTNGSGAMPPFKDTLTEQQINDVAAYVSSVAGT